MIGICSGEKFIGHVVHTVSIDLLLSLHHLVQLTEYGRSRRRGGFDVVRSIRCLRDGQCARIQLIKDFLRQCYRCLNEHGQ